MSKFLEITAYGNRFDIVRLFKLFLTRERGSYWQKEYPHDNEEKAPHINEDIKLENYYPLDQTISLSGNYSKDVQRIKLRSPDLSNDDIIKIISSGSNTFPCPKDTQRGADTNYNIVYAEGTGDSFKLRIERDVVPVHIINELLREYEIFEDLDWKIIFSNVLHDNIVHHYSGERLDYDWSQHDSDDEDDQEKYWDAYTLINCSQCLSHGIRKHILNTMGLVPNDYINYTCSSCG